MFFLPPISLIEHQERFLNLKLPMRCSLGTNPLMSTYGSLDLCVMLITIPEPVISLMPGLINAFSWATHIVRKGGKFTTSKPNKCTCLGMWYFMSTFFYGLRDKIHVSLQVMRMIFPINFWSKMIHHLMLSSTQPPKLGQRTPLINLSLLHRPTKIRRLHIPF